MAKATKATFFTGRKAFSFKSLKIYKEVRVEESTAIIKKLLISHFYPYYFLSFFVFI